MKQRRFPVVPVTLLVILIGGAVVMTLKPLDAVPQAEKPPEEIVTDARQKITTSDLVKVASEQSKTKKAGPRVPDEPENNEPALLLPASMDYRPSPNATSTTPQWWKEEARKSATTSN